MKRWIKAQYIPDMTERYPEGTGSNNYSDYTPSELATLEEVVTEYKTGAEEGDYYTNVKLIGSDGQLLLECTDLDDIFREFPKMQNKLVERFWWHDTDIGIRLA